MFSVCHVVDVATYVLEPHDGEDDVREGSHLFDVHHLTHGQVDLNTSRGAQRGAHLLHKTDRRVSVTSLRHTNYIPVDIILKKT